MTGAAKTILIIFLLPLLLAIGNDIYINYLSDDEKIQEVKNLQINPEEFMFSDLGWVWQHYSPNTLKTTHDSVDEVTWDQYFNPVLEKKTIYLGLIPFLSAGAFLIFTAIFGVWPFSRFGRRIKDGSYSTLKGDKEHRYKFGKK